MKKKQGRNGNNRHQGKKNVVKKKRYPTTTPGAESAHGLHKGFYLLPERVALMRHAQPTIDGSAISDRSREHISFLAKQLTEIIPEGIKVNIVCSTENRAKFTANLLAEELEKLGMEAVYSRPASWLSEFGQITKEDICEYVSWFGSASWLILISHQHNIVRFLNGNEDGSRNIKFCHFESKRLVVTGHS